MYRMNTLLYCLDVLKIKEGTEVYGNAIELAPKVPVEFANESIIAIKIIANASLGYTFSQSQLSDFLTLATKGIEEKKTSSQIITFNMYRDIIENYDKFSDSLKSNYPGIIVDVISVINRGTDTKGTKVSIVGLERYYQSRKRQAVMSNAVKEEHSPAIISPSSINTTAAAVHKKILSSNNELVEKLAQITNRKRHDIEQSLTRLYDSDVKKINELCRNYSKLQHYSSKLITKEEFKNEIQKEIGRELRPYQLTIAANSIRRVQLYIENILDNKFVHDASHGINHVKHNLEYGYQLMNLIEGPRRIKRQRSQ
jgi:ribosomal protein L23